MSAEDIAICSMCQMTFGSHEKVLGHKCMEKTVAEEIIYHKENDSSYSSEMKINKKNIAKKRDINQVEKDENVLKMQGKTPLSRLMIWDHLKEKAVTCMSVNFKDEAIAYVLEHFGVIEDQLTDASLKSLEKKIKTFHGDLRARMKKMRGKYQDYRDRVGKDYLSKLFTFDLETCDDLDNFPKNDECRNYPMTNDHHRNSVDFEDMSSGNEKLGVKVNAGTNEYQKEKERNDNSNVELSERFIWFIIQQVDELCEYIKTGDPDMKRTREVNRKLNNAVDCYIIKLDSETQIFVEAENVDCHDEIGITSDNESNSKDVFRSKLDLEKEIFVEHHDVVIESRNEFKSKDFLHDSKIPEKKLKESKSPEKKEADREKSNDVNNENLQPGKNKCGRRGRKRRSICIDEKFELVKNQCGRHNVSSMALILNIHRASLQYRITKEGITFTKKVLECKLCEMKRNTIDMKKDVLLPFLRFNSNENKFECSLCIYSISDRKHLYSHLRSKHRNEIIEKPDRLLENNQECNGSVCKKVYGSKNTGKKLWCKKCLKELQLVKEKRKELMAGVCPECGLLEKNLDSHIRYMHQGKTQVCPLCSHEFRNLILLNKHNKAVHEKAPCTECGKMIGVKNMNTHIQAAHTPDNLKKYRCDACGKGFIDNHRLSDHVNVHTGEKPYKCKFCSSCFASKGTHAMHERSHLGCGRKIKK